MELIITAAIGIWAAATVAGYYWPARSQAGPVLAGLMTLSAVSMATVLAGTGVLFVGFVN